MKGELIIDYIKGKVSSFLEKFDLATFDKFDPEIASISVNLYVLKQVNENGKVFIPLGTSDRPKGLRLTPNSQLVVVLDKDNSNPLFIFKNDLQKFVKENKNLCENSIDKEFETAGYDVDYDKLKEHIESIDASNAPF